MEKKRKFICRRKSIRGTGATESVDGYMHVSHCRTKNKMQERFVQMITLERAKNEAEQRKVMEEACRLLEPEICKLIRKRFKTYIYNDPDFFWDLKAAALCTVMEKLPEYDPSKGMPLTFFYPYIMHELVEETSCMKHGIHGSYLTAQKSIDKIKVDYEDAGRCPEPVDYACAMGLPLHSVQRLLIEKNTKISYLDDTLYDIIPGNGESDSGYFSPEEIMIKKDSTAFLRHKIDMKFTPSEKVIFFMYLDGHRAAEIGRQIGKSNDYVLRVIESCKQMLQFDLEIREYFSGIWRNDDRVLDRIGVPNFADE